MKMSNIVDRFVSHVSSIDGLDKETAARSVVISKISPKTRDEDIVIYFQKRKNGGGELEHVRISDEGQVVVTFEAREVAERILQRRHRLNGSELELSPYRFVSQEPPEVFLQVSARVNFEVSGLSSKKSRSLLKKVQKMTNINWHEGCDGFILSGTFSQLEHSRKIFGTFLGCRSSQHSGRTESPRCAPEHLAINENTVTSNICRVEVQPQFMKLLNRVYEKKIQDMEEKFCIEILWEENTARAEIRPRKEMPNTKLYHEGCDAFITLYQKVFGEMRRELITLANQEDEKAINEVIDAVTARNIVVVEKLDCRLSVYGFKMEITKAVQDLKRRLALSNRVSQRTKHGQKETAAISGGLNNLNTAFLDKPELRHTLSNGVQISLRQGDITEEHVDAIVNAANEMLRHGGGVAGAILSKGGRQIDDESRKVMSNRRALEAGEVVYTRGGNLRCQYVVHAVGPRWKDHGHDDCIFLLVLACVASLRLAVRLNLRSIALPAISSGIFGMPKDLCAEAMFDAVEEFSFSVDAKFGNLRDVRIVIIDDTTVEVFRKEFKKRYHSQGRLPTRSANQTDQLGAGNPCAERVKSCEENGGRVSETNIRDPIAEATKTKETPPANKDASSGETRRSSENETAPLSEVGGEGGNSKKMEEPLRSMATKAEGKHSTKTLNDSKENLSGREASEIVAKTDNTKVHGKCSLMVEHGLVEAPLENRNSHGHDTSGPGTAPHSKENENGDSKNIKEPLGERSERPKDEQSIRTLIEGKDSLFSEEAGASVEKTENTETESKVSVNADQELPKGPTENPSQIVPSKGILGRGRGALVVCFPTRTNRMAPHPQSAGQLDATTEARKLPHGRGRWITAVLDSSTKGPPGLNVTSEGLQLAKQGAVCKVEDSSSSAKADGNHVSNLTNAATRREGIAGPAVESEAPSEPCSDNDKTSAADAPHNDEEGSKLDMLNRHSPSGETPGTEHPNESQYVTENKLEGEKRPPKVPYLLTDVPKDSKATAKVPSEETVARLQTTSNKFDTENSAQSNPTGDSNINDVTIKNSDASSQKTKLLEDAEEKSVQQSQLAESFDDDPSCKTNALVSPGRLLDTARSAETAGSDPKESDSKLYALSPETSIENVRNKRSSKDEAISCNKFPKLENAEKSSQKVDSGLPRVLPSDVPSDVKPASNVEPLDAREDEEETSFRDSTIKGEESPVASPEDATFSQGGIKKAIHPIKEKGDDDSSVNITASSDILADEDPDTPPPQHEEIKNCCDQSICCICRLPPSDSVNLPGCAYTSCSSCFEGETLCPLCNNDFPDDEIFQGRQPVGGMTWRVESRRFLPGYEGCGTIVINYNFPNGTQGPEHPNPGAPFQGRLVTSYLPDNTEGRSVLRLLTRAFNAGLLFTVGPSSVNGELDQVIWYDVEHKTNIEGGPANFGYPDPSYLDRVRAQLRVKGVVYCGSDPMSKRMDELKTRYK